MSIRPTAGGLYEIVAHGAGANPPAPCSGQYTSHLKARQELEKYLAETDRNGYAEYPSKPASEVRPSKVRKAANGSEQN